MEMRENVRYRLRKTCDLPSIIHFGGDTMTIKNDTVILISPLLFYFLNQTIHEL